MMRIPVAKEGILYSAFPLFFGILLLSFKLWILGAIFLFIAAAVVLFFRFPDRSVSVDNDKIYAPADGRIVHIKDDYTDYFYKEIIKKISIFMSIFNVHINYAPITGNIDYVKYAQGNFRRADLVTGEETNENNFINIVSGNLKVGVRQVAGWVARRIVCKCKIGDKIDAGNNFGLIKFGSRVDIYIPVNFDISINFGETVRAGRTVLAIFKK